MNRFQSLGIDDVYFYLPLWPEETERLSSLCVIPGWFDKDGGWTLLCGSRKVPQAMIRMAGQAVILKLNVPKLIWKHNVRLAGPKELRIALRRMQAFTGFDLENAKVLQVDVCYCESHDEPLRQILTQFSCPKGFELIELEYGVYYNGKKGRVTFSLYDKREHLRKHGLKVPNDVLTYCDTLESELHRYELRIGNDETGRSVNSELKRFGFWNGPYFLGSDLHSNHGFNALIQYYERIVLGQIILLRQKRGQRRANSLATIKSRVAIEHMDQTAPERYLALAEELHSQGDLPIHVLEATRKEVERLQYWQGITGLRNRMKHACDGGVAANPIEMEG